MMTERHLSLHSLWLLFFLAVSLPLASAVSAETDSPDAPKKHHKLVYQLNKADPATVRSVLFSITEMKEKYADDIDIVVVAFGPGIHLLAQHPRRAIDPRRPEQAEYLSMTGVQFHACANTMKGLHWTANDLLDFAEVVPVGAEDLMLLQEQGYSYISW
ncbi:MAG: DsrE family protein [gamma proteobacterium symbiont of Bathyaustriella thionipta]|nr:DsrE family protein [gamma proteobacterium symbiont of Bathyaustriella thionipta]